MNLTLIYTHTLQAAQRGAHATGELWQIYK